MVITIDKAGRLIVPKELRERYNMHAGTQIEIEPEADGIRLRVVGMRPSLIRRRGILIHHGGATVDLDVASFLDREREGRDLEIAAERPLPRNAEPKER